MGARDVLHRVRLRVVAVLSVRGLGEHPELQPPALRPAEDLKTGLAFLLHREQLLCTG